MVWYSSQSKVLLHCVVDWDPFYSQLTTLTRREGGGGRDKGSEGGREEGGRERGREGREGGGGRIGGRRRKGAWEGREGGKKRTR